MGIGDSRKALIPFSRKAILALLRKENAKGYFVLNDEKEDEAGSVYILQRWSDKWQAYVDVSRRGNIVFKISTMVTNVASLLDVLNMNGG